jgi:hypothetical protein
MRPKPFSDLTIDVAEESPDNVKQKVVRRLQRWIALHGEFEAIAKLQVLKHYPYLYCRVQGLDVSMFNSDDEETALTQECLEKLDKGYSLNKLRVVAVHLQTHIDTSDISRCNKRLFTIRLKRVKSMIETIGKDLDHVIENYPYHVPSLGAFPLNQETTDKVEDTLRSRIP